MQPHDYVLNAETVLGTRGTIATVISQYKRFLIACEEDPKLFTLDTQVFSVLRALRKANSLIIDLTKAFPPDDPPSQE